MGSKLRFALLRTLYFHASCLIIFLVLCFAASVPSTGSSEHRKFPKQTDSIHVGKNIQVSLANGNLHHTEAVVTADVADPNHLLVCSLIQAPLKGPTRGTGVTYSSTDGGKTWGTAWIGKPEWIMSDPSCAFGPNGTAYVVMFALTNDGRDAESLLYRSVDGGRSWESPISHPARDLEWLSVDNSSMQHNGTLYLTSDTSPLPWRSVDDGKTWEKLGTIGFGKKVAPEWQGQSVIMSDGTFVWIFGEELDDPGNPSLENPPATWVQKGRIHSVTFPFGSKDAEALSNIDMLIKKGNQLTSAAPVPRLGVDLSSGPFHDRLYGVWVDSRGGGQAIRFAYSADRGKTWSEPTAIDAPPIGHWLNSSPDNFNPGVAVNSNGVVGVSWYDRRESPDNLGYTIRFTASFDGGETFVPSVRISEGSSDVFHDKLMQAWIRPESKGENQLPADRVSAVGYIDRFNFLGGDYASLTADSAGRFWPLWIDNHTGVRQLWTAPIVVEGRAAQSAELLSDDVTAELRLDYKSGTYQEKTRSFEEEFEATNIGDRPLRLPLRVKVLELTSEYGTAAIVGSDNGLQSTGAIVTLGSATGKALLRPGETTEQRLLSVYLANRPPLQELFRENYRLPVFLFHLHAKVYEAKQ